MYSNDENPQQVINAATSGNWRVTYFFDTDSDETQHFNNYSFNFADNGVLTATNGTNAYTGTWSVTDSHSGNDDSDHYSSDDVDFNIFLPSPAQFAQPSDDWDIVSCSANEIRLTDVSGGNGGTDYLTFEKTQWPSLASLSCL
jgi:hypothetical protein